ncbi:hypothetical protein FOPG_17399 [Fusarium oxysporum f. sp. conglutinans race 2 54008]|nr:hypothetical protein FOPG_17399 [Fusarium oxysporum f. sp. conglutinans race 2 54008]KAF6512897.1 hypothetical protein HZS61_007703 [Fusarium oxysporum f. sp. conglutinans]KAG7003760.1 hypothetical protein FocnCong_v000914 [Fusarium oxysporum f. sp. conglutinans]KAI8395738.1 hypothetical protein FOFC_21268 [Fusarium oxysporum]
MRKTSSLLQGDKECAPQDEHKEEDEIGDSGDDAPMTSSPKTSSPSKDRASKRRRRNPETESEPQHQPEPVSTEGTEDTKDTEDTEDTEDEEDEADTEGSRGIDSSSAQAKGVPSIQEYRKRIDADRHPLERYKAHRDVTQTRIDEKNTLDKALELATSNRDSIRDAKRTSDEENRKAEQADEEMTAAKAREDEHAASEPALQAEVAPMERSITLCEEKIAKGEKDMGATLCLQSAQRLSLEDLRTRPAEQVNKLQLLLNDFERDFYKL